MTRDEIEPIKIAVDLELLKRVVEAAEDNAVELLNDHVDKNQNYMHTAKNRSIANMYNNQIADIAKLKDGVF